MPSVVKKVLIPVAVSVTALSLWRLLRFVLLYHPYRSPLRHLRGPNATHFILGNLTELTNDISEDSTLIEQWVEEHGNVLKFNGILNNSQLITMDTRAINHILTHSNDYQKSPDARQALEQIFGQGLLVVEGAQHRQQRHIMNPAFGPVQIHALTETFLAKADCLRDILLSEITKDSTAAITGTRINIVPWLNKVTLDIIGLTGFDYNFDALDSHGKLNVLSEALSTMFSTSQDITLLDILQILIPVLRHIPNSQSRKMKAAKRTIEDIGKGLLTSAKAGALASASEDREIEKNSLHGRDLLSLLVKANMATDILESQKLSDQDVIAQVPTFFVAGHETTSAIIWALYALTQAPEVQTKLRDELFSVVTDMPSMDELMALPYLDAVVRETLCLHAPVPGILRVAMKDDELPVERPYLDRHGAARTTIPIAKGDPILLPILAMNRSKALWGADAHEFKPERWHDLPETVSQVPGVWGHMLTFIGGPRACIGYRFSLVETKAILFSLVRAFEFELAVPVGEVGKRTVIVQRPVLRNDPTHESQLPLLVRPYTRT